MSAEDPYFESTYRREHVPKSKQTNPLLIRDPVGTVRPSTYTLPGENFTYGKPEQVNPNGSGVRECLSSWNDNREEKNRLKPSYTKAIDPPVAYGRPSDKSTPMDALITNQYQREAILTQRTQNTGLIHLDPAAVQRAQRKEANARVNAYAKNGVPHTKASLGHTVPKPEEPKELFKLERFKNVPSRIRLVNQPDYVGTATTTANISNTHTQHYEDVQEGVPQQI